MRYGLPSCMSVKTTWGAGAVWEEAPPRAIIPDARPLGTFGKLTVTRAIPQ